MVEFLLAVVNGISAAHFLGSLKYTPEPDSSFQYLNFCFTSFFLELQETCQKCWNINNQ